MDIVTFPDHHFYRATDWDMIEKRFAAAGADILMTTEKDAVRLISLEGSVTNYSEALYYLEINVEITEGETMLRSIVDSKMRWTP